MFDHDEFNKQRDLIRQKISNVIIELQKTLQSSIKTMSEREVCNHLIAFFDYYSLAIIDDAKKLRFITENNGKINFYIAQFILSAMNEKSLIWSYLLEITSGFLAYKAIYYYSLDSKSSEYLPLSGTMFFLDCSLVIDCLGYDTSSDEKSIDELIDIILRCKGRVLVFPHIIEEAQNLVRSYATNTDRRNDLI